MLASGKITEGIAPLIVVVTWTLEKLITEVVTAGIMMVVVTVTPTKVVDPELVVDHPISRVVVNGGR
jgi:hypothetical protein